MNMLRLSAKPEHVKKLRVAGYTVSDATLNCPIADVYIHGIKDSKTFKKHQEIIQGVLEIPSDCISYS